MAVHKYPYIFGKLGYFCKHGNVRMRLSNEDWDPTFMSIPVTASNQTIFLEG